MELTPEQFNKLALKQDLVDFKEELGEKFVSKEYFDEKIDALFEVMDGLAKSVKDIGEEKISNQAAHDRMDGKIDNHEIRLKKLEPKSV